MYNSRISFQSPNLNVMYTACVRAARGLVRDFGEVEHLQVSKKGPGDFVSIADKRAEKIIIENLQKARPAYGFLVEESGEIKGANDEFRWIVDPLDGTTNFLHAIPHFAISIALEQRGEIICGVVYDPIKDELFYAEKGRGAFLNEKRLRVAGRRDFADAVLGITFPRKNYKHEDEFYKKFRAVEASTAAMRRLGSAVLDTCYVAAGRLDAYWAMELNPWDKAAASLIVTEAGGYATDHLGNKDIINTPSFIAGNEPMYDALIKFL